MFRNRAHHAASRRADAHACNVAVRIADNQHRNTAKRRVVRTAQCIGIVGTDAHSFSHAIRLRIAVECSQHHNT